MGQNEEFIDIYSHSGSTISHETVKRKRNFKSSRILKSILCFFALFIGCSAIVATYVFGVYVGEMRINLLNSESDETQSHIEISQNYVDADIENAIDSVVGISVFDDDNYEYASGVIISSDGFIVTNDHVFLNVKSPKIKVYDKNGDFYDAAFIGSDAKYDIAVIKIEKLNLEPMIPAEQISVGDMVYCIGCPLNETLNMSVTQGVISGINRRIGSLSREYSPRLIQTDAAINPGSSGGALVNSSGRLIGICTSKVALDGYENIGFAIPIDKVLEITEKLIGNGSVYGRAKLGISYSFIDLARAFAENIEYGVKIESIEIMSDLYGKGFGRGDTITQINGIRIKSEDDFLSVIEALKPKDKISVTIVTQSGTSRETEVTLIEEKPKSSYK